MANICTCIKRKGHLVLPPAFWEGGVASHWCPPLPGGAFDAAGAGAAFPAGACEGKFKNSSSRPHQYSTEIYFKYMYILVWWER